MTNPISYRDAPLQNYYAILDVPESASPGEIKQAYHRALLRFHPDKQARSKASTIVFDRLAHPPTSVSLSNSATSGSLDSNAYQHGWDVHVLKQAYEVLRDTASRKAYDASLVAGKKSGPRPAEVISLQDFTEEPEDTSGPDSSAQGQATDGALGTLRWTYACRCGGRYMIDEEVMERGQHIVGCSCCSETIWVGYEVVEGEEEE